VLRAGDTALRALDQRVPPGHVRRRPHAHRALAGACRASTSSSSSSMVCARSIPAS
jgi:hypothetical protein